MNLNTHSLFRYLCIDLFLRTKPSPTLSKLTAFCKMQSQELGNVQPISRKTILRDIQDMKTQFSCPIEFKKTGTFYYYKIPDYTFLNVSPETLHNLMQNVKVNFVIGESEKIGDVIQFESVITDNGVANVAIIGTGIISKRMIEFQYQSITDKRPKKHCVSPHLLKQNGNSWYLLAVKDGENGIRTYNLARLASVATLSKRKSVTKAIATSEATAPKQKGR